MTIQHTFIWISVGLLIKFLVFISYLMPTGIQMILNEQSTQEIVTFVLLNGTIIMTAFLPIELWWMKIALELFQASDDESGHE